MIVEASLFAKSVIVREALDAYFTQEPQWRAGSCLDQVRDLVGSTPGPADLVTNKRYIKGFGK